ncbi:hypothetical protein D9V87_06325 [Bacteroidetes/Chlorobi group bacterium MS-B_bin-24]|jgi:hypothetical protein|nr:MAG: hypothetical protein D9V87_06325 [Bacteroidetes/Chlorobi group bacterium MS-B_bin-24]
MAVLSIESNGTIEMTAVYYNGQQLAGISELFLNLDEDGTFDAVISYTGSDGVEYLKNPFVDYLDNVIFREPAFTEEEASQLHLLTIESDGDIENTTVYYDEEPLDGLVNLFVHIKSPAKNKSGIASVFKKVKPVEGAVFKATFTFRYPGDVIKTEEIF